MSVAAKRFREWLAWLTGKGQRMRYQDVPYINRDGEMITPQKEDGNGTGQ